MGSTRDLLHDGEELLAEVRPHPVVVVRPVVLFLVVLAGAVSLAIGYPRAPIALAWVLAGTVALFGLRLGIRILRWRCVQFLVTSRRILYRRGVLGRDVIQLRLQRVAEVHCRQSLGGRVIGSGRLVFEVAGGDGPLVVDDLRSPRRLQGIITAQLDRFDQLVWNRAVGPYGGAPGGVTPARSGGRPRTAADTPPNGVVLGDEPVGTIPGKILQLDELRRRGILSEDEFATKKAELLGRL